MTVSYHVGEAIKALDQAKAANTSGDIKLSQNFFKEMRGHLEKAHEVDAKNFELIKKLMY